MAVGLTRPSARSSIGAGYVADVEPTDSAAVAKALKPVVESKPVVAKPTANKAAQASG